jgi:putative ABC transport system permease protein
LLTESMLLSVLGGALGLLLAVWGTGILVASSPASVPRIQSVSIDGVVLGVTLVTSIVAGVLFGLAPALHYTKPELNEAMKESGRGSAGSTRGRRIGNTLVVSEISLALLLLIGAGLIAKSFYELAGADQGYNPQNVLTAQISLSYTKYSEMPKRTAFYEQVLERIRSSPGVQTAGLVSAIPASISDQRGIITLEGQQDLPPGELPRVAARVISPGFFGAMGIKLLSGRDFTDMDIRRDFGPAGSQTVQVIVNESMARLYWPNEDPVGKRIAIGLPPRRSPFVPIIGMVDDVRHWVDAEPEPTFYLCNLVQQSMTLALRTSSDPASLSHAVWAAVASVDKDQPVHDVLTMEQRLIGADPISQARFRTLLLVLFALSALVLAAVGIYGVVSHSVIQRTREIGIRMALGAQPKHILRMVMGHGTILTLIGVGLGLVSAFALTRLLSTQLLFGVNPTDATVFGGAAVSLALISLLATYLPARKARRADPLEILRYE